MKNEKRYYKTGAAADYLGLSRRYLHELTSQGRIPFSRIGRRTMLFRKDDLDGFVDQHMIQAM